MGTEFDTDTYRVARRVPRTIFNKESFQVKKYVPVTTLQDEEYTVDRKVPTTETVTRPFQVTRTVPYQSDRLVKSTEYDTEEYVGAENYQTTYLDREAYTEDRQVPRTI